MLSQKRVDLLNDTVPDWTNGRLNTKEERWMERFEQLKSFQKTQDHQRIPSKNKDLKLLYQWVCLQRSLHKKNELDQKRMDLLNSIGFDWHPWFSHSPALKP